MRRIPLGSHEILHETLDNGLEVLILADPASPVSALHHWFKVGSRNEREGKTGLAHLFEHLMFGETENLRRFVEAEVRERLGLPPAPATP